MLAERSLCHAWSTLASVDENKYERACYFPHLFAAAFFAIAARRSGLMLLARAFPPRLPSATAAAFLPSSVSISVSSPVRMRMTFTALPITSAGRRSPLGPLGMLAAHTNRRIGEALQRNLDYAFIEHRQLPFSCALIPRPAIQTLSNSTCARLDAFVMHKPIDGG